MGGGGRWNGEPIASAAGPCNDRWKGKEEGGIDPSKEETVRNKCSQVETIIKSTTASLMCGKYCE